MEEHICKFCGAQQKFSKNKNKWYCGALCWQNPKKEEPRPDNSNEGMRIIGEILADMQAKVNLLNETTQKIYKILEEQGMTQ